MSLSTLAGKETHRQIPSVLSQAENHIIDKHPVAIGALPGLWRDIHSHQACDIDLGTSQLLERLCKLIGANSGTWSITGTTPNQASKDLMLASGCWDDASFDSFEQASTLQCCINIKPGLSVNFTFIRRSHHPRFESSSIALIDLAFSGLSRWLHWLALSHAPAVAKASKNYSPLPPHQRKVLLLLVTGLSEKQIAAELNLSNNTVHNYVTTLYRHFGVRNRQSLAALWLAETSAMVCDTCIDQDFTLRGLLIA